MLTISDCGREGARVLLAMSGGVDSAASAVILQRAGFRVLGVTMKNYCYTEAESAGAVTERSCCSLAAIDDARGACARLDIPHMVADAEDLFGREVYDDFLSEYRAGRTPNPCVRCNSIVRFRILEDTADRLGAEYVATGHYARLFRSEAGRQYVARARYADKDQSYFLSGLRHEDLRRVIFPLGEYRKPDVRAAAREAGLVVADKPESQEVCFIPEGSLRDFLDGKIDLVPGDIEDTEGNVIGRHEGLGAYTVGQRRGLGVAAGRPMYVVRLDLDRNVLVVGEDNSLYRNELVCRLKWIDTGALEGEGVSAQIRSRSEAVPVARVALTGIDGETRVTFAAPQRAIAPGQTVAFYSGDVVIGSGVILS
jgi:tRNA-specific 2-thiouridylase